MKRKLISILLLLTLTMSLPIYAEDSKKELPPRSANGEALSKEILKQIEKNQKWEETKKDDGIVKEINEFDLFTDLKKSTDDELMKIGYTKEEIVELRSFDYATEIKKLDEKSDDELLKMGFDLERIEKIRAFDGKLSSIKSASGTLSFDYDAIAYEYTNGRTHFANRLKWEWSGVPFYTFHDVVASSCSEGMYRHASAYHQVHYYQSDNLNNMVDNVIFSMDSNGEPTGLQGNVFDVNTFSPGDQIKPIAMDGYAYFYWQKLGKVEQVSGYIKYGHSSFTVKPEFSLNNSGYKLTITPAITTSTKYNKYFYEEIKNW
jgi:hypothetical protein